MIIEYTYSQRDLQKKCYNCMFLEMEDDWYGKCVCTENKVKFRNRKINDKACVCKKENPRKE